MATQAPAACGAQKPVSNLTIPAIVRNVTWYAQAGAPSGHPNKGLVWWPVRLPTHPAGTRPGGPVSARLWDECWHLYDVDTSLTGPVGRSSATMI